MPYFPKKKIHSIKILQNYEEIFDYANKQDFFYLSSQVRNSPAYIAPTIIHLQL